MPTLFLKHSASTDFHRPFLPPAVVNLLNHIALFTFAALSLLPGNALAYAQVNEQPNQPFQFHLDGSWSDYALDGITAFPRAMSAQALLASDYARIPDYSPLFAADMRLRVIATAYSSDINQTDADPHRTASGTYVHSGTLAANFLPFGTTVEINGKNYIVEDRLNARYNQTYIVDLWMPSQDQALIFGLRLVEMKIISLP